MSPTVSPSPRSRSASRSNRSICSLVRRLPIGSLLGSCRDDYHIRWTNFRGADHSNVVVSRNTTGGNGGGIYNGGTLTVGNSTITGNSAGASSGGGIYVGFRLTTRNTIIAGNTASSGPDVLGNMGSQGYNLLGNPVDASGWVDTDILHVNAMLGPLQDNGGTTPTMAPLPGSPALDAGDPDQLGVPDQRRVVRSGGVNIGAYQASASIFLQTAPAKVTAGVPFDLTVTAVDPFGQLALGYRGTVTFSTTDSDPGVVLPADYT